MHRFRNLIAGLGLSGAAVAAIAVPALAQKPFDPDSDPAAQLSAAEQTAQREHKRIFLDVGGNWCGWCMVLDRTMHSDAALHQELESHFVVVHANWDPKHENTAFFSQFPRATGYPFFLILDAHGKLLTAQSTDIFETDHKLGNGYNVDALKRFFVQWSSPGAA